MGAWLEARIAHLEHEKEFTRLRDELARECKELPWVRGDKEYVFSTNDGHRSLADLLAGRRQLLIYHFMFDPDWGEGFFLQNNCLVAMWSRYPLTV